MSFNAEERLLLADLADVLIPHGEKMPSASQADVAGQWLDQVLAARPDLGQALAELLPRARGRQPAEFVAELQRSDADAFGALAEITAGAYFLDPSVQKAIGYSGQTPQAIDPRPDYMEDGLLESVIRRGPIYRPTPQPGGRSSG